MYIWGQSGKLLANWPKLTLYSRYFQLLRYYVWRSENPITHWFPSHFIPCGSRVAWCWTQTAGENPASRRRRVPVGPALQTEFPPRTRPSSYSHSSLYSWNCIHKSFTLTTRSKFGILFSQDIICNDLLRFIHVMCLIFRFIFRLDANERVVLSVLV